MTTELSPNSEVLPTPEKYTLAVFAEGWRANGILSRAQKTLSPESFWAVLATVALVKSGMVGEIIFSGGVISKGHPESLEMQRAFRMFVSEEEFPIQNIFLDPRSRHTRENAHFSALIIRERGLNNVALLTQQIHLERSRHHFEKNGISVCKTFVSEYVIKSEASHFRPLLQKYKESSRFSLKSGKERALRAILRFPKLTRTAELVTHLLRRTPSETE